MFFRVSHKQLISSDNVDFQARMYDLGVLAPSSQGPIPCAVVFTQRSDMESSDLSLGLAKEGVRLLRINVDEPAANSVTGLDSKGFVIGAHDLLRPIISWTRHTFGTNTAQSDDPFESAYVSSQGEHLRIAIKEMASQEVNGHVVQTHRLSQMKIAKACGFHTPRTLVTSKPASAVAALPRDWGNLFVVKAIGEHWVEHPWGILNGIFPATRTRDALIKTADEKVPVIIQEHVQHLSELRVYVVGSTVIAYRVTQKKDAASSWTDPETAEIRPVELDPMLLERINQFRTQMKLDIGAIDILVRPAGPPSFLEVNLNGDWRYFEGEAGDTRVTDAVKFYIKERVASDV